MRAFAEKAARLVGQAPFKVLARAQELERQGREILHFEIGEPDFNTPGHIKDAAKDALDTDFTHYVNASGILDLREAVCDEIEASYGFRPAVEQVLITPGANPIIYFTVSCLVGDGEEVIVQDPGFITYYAVLQYLGVKTTLVPLREEEEFRMSPEEVRARVTGRTKMIILNSPHNPTGSVMLEREVEEIAEIAREHDIYLLSDEIYRKMTYDTKHHSPARLDQCRERTIILDGFSKAYAMTGWRLGYCVAPALLIEKMGLLLQTIASCTTSFVQKGGIAALKGSHDPIACMMGEFRRRREAIVSGLNSLPKIRCINPQGAFYVFPNITGTGMTSQEFTDFLLNDLGIAVLPGTAFGPSGEGYIRMSYATSVDTIHRAIERMRSAL